MSQHRAPSYVRTKKLLADIAALREQSAGAPIFQVFDHFFGGGGFAGDDDDDEDDLF